MNKMGPKQLGFLWETTLCLNYTGLIGLGLIRIVTETIYLKEYSSDSCTTDYNQQASTPL